MAADWNEIDINDTLIVVKMETSEGKCQCCLSEEGAALISMSQKFLHEGRLETYYSMLTSCFSLELLDCKDSLLICSKCTSRLKEGCAFKNQVLLAQNKIKMDFYRDYPIDECNEIKLQTDGSSSENGSPTPFENIFPPGIIIKRIESDVTTSLKRIMRKKSPRAAPSNSVFSPGANKRTPQNTKRITKEKLQIKIAKFEDVDESICVQIINEPTVRVRGKPNNATTFSTTFDESSKGIADEKRTTSSQIKAKSKTKNKLPFIMDENELCCPICKEEFTVHKFLLSHMSVHYPNYICSQCGKPFDTVRKLHSHRSRKHNNPYIPCAVCGKSIKTSSMPRHVGIHNGVVTTYACPSCPERFKSFARRMTHIANIHNGGAHTFKCTQCPKVFRSGTLMKSHLRRVHYKEKKHPCSECDRVFFDKVQLTQHMRRHTGEKFKCEICSKSYVRKSVLNAHIRNNHT